MPAHHPILQDLRNRAPAIYPSVTLSPSSSAASDRRRSKHMNDRDRPSSCSLTNKAAPSCPASAALKGWRASSKLARDLTAKTSVTSSQVSAKVSNRSSTCRRSRRETAPSRARRSIALASSTRVHAHVTISLSSASQVRASSVLGSETSRGTSADASQYLTSGRRGLDPELRRCWFAAFEATLPGSRPNLLGRGAEPPC